jgi:hypothetical protein
VTNLFEFLIKTFYTLQSNKLQNFFRFSSTASRDEEAAEFVEPAVSSRSAIPRRQNAETSKDRQQSW